MRINEEKLLSVLAMVIASLFFMPLVGMYLICKKNSNTTMRIVGMALLVVGIMISIHVTPFNGFLFIE